MVVVHVFVYMHMCACVHMYVHTHLALVSKGHLYFIEACTGATGLLDFTETSWVGIIYAKYWHLLVVLSFRFGNFSFSLCSLFSLPLSYLLSQLLPLCCSLRV